MSRQVSMITSAAALLLLLLAASMGANASAAGTCSDANPWPYARNFLRPTDTMTVGQTLENKNAMLTITTEGNVKLIRKKDQKTVWETTTVCPNATLSFNQTVMALTSAGKSLCWFTVFSAPTAVVALTDHCAFEAYQEAPFTNMTWNSNAAACVTAHIIPHSHDDVGWLLTPERYYDGCQTPGGGVRGILDTVVQALQIYPNRTYNQVESYFFNRWWLEQNETTKAIVKRLVKNGQFVFINGGWSMHDEACVHQESAISNMEVGARFIKEEFNVTMNIGWHIDPFGHASATPRYMAEMGFDAFFFWRTDYEHKDYMLQKKTMESMWYNSPALGNKTLMFTSIMFNNYCYGCSDNTCPSQFYSYDCMYNDLPFSRSWAAQVLEKANAQKRTDLAKLMRVANFRPQDATQDRYAPSLAAIAESYVQSIKSYELSFRTGHVMMPWGCDFLHENAVDDFELMDMVINFINQNYDKYGVEIFYSTVPAYVQAVRDMNYTWPVNEHDYFLDSDGAHSYWSGYLSSRAEYKGYERHLMNERTSADIAISAVPQTTFANFTDSLAKVEVMREAMGVAQHHDSITGTERTAVRNQYQFLLNRGFDSIDSVVAEALGSVTGTATTGAPAPCKLANLSYCPLTDSLSSTQNVSMYVFNPLAQTRTEIITVPVPVANVAAYLMPQGLPLQSQTVATWELTTTVDNTSPAVPQHSPYQLYVQVEIPPLTLIEVTLTVNASASSSEKSGVTVALLADDAPTTIMNEYYSLTFDPVTKRLMSVTNSETGITSLADQSIGWYCPYPSRPNEQADGAYIMRTCEPNAVVTPYATNFTAEVVSGPMCTEVRQKINAASNINQAFRLCRGQRYVEIQSGIGEVETLGTGVEVIMNIKTDIPSQGVWYTDSQALEMQQRVRDSRPNYPYTVTEPIAANFFPCNAFALMNSTQDYTKNMAVMADRSRATASINDGELQFLVQRRLIYDDNRGVMEPLDEITRVLTTSRAVFNTPSVYRDMREQSLLMTHKPIVRFGAPSGATSGFPHFSNPGADLLPAQVHLHTRTVHKPGELILRLQHLYGKGEGPMAVPVTVTLQNALPTGMKVLAVTDMDMNAVREASGMKRLDFRLCKDGQLDTVPPIPIGGASPVTNGTLTTFTLHPMEIRVLRINFEW